jgi:glucose/mannose-6-phosphate isomerase
MGGSGVSGDVLRSLFAARVPVPIAVVKGYSLPEFCGRDTLVIASSFSGNTEETVAAYTEAVARGCRVVAACSGGELASLAEADDVPRVAIPGHVAVPRAALGYLAAAPLGVLDSMGVVPGLSDEVERAARLLEELALELGPTVATNANEAKGLASWMHTRSPVVWGSEGLAEAPALRWKTQLNENAKVPAWYSVLPELDHNEIEGWSEGSGDGVAVTILRHHLEHPHIKVRVQATLESIGASAVEAREVWARGASPMEQLFSLVMLGDFVSTYLGIIRGVDPTEIAVLSGLKRRLRDEAPD